MSFSEVELSVIRWSEKRLIIPNSTAVAQGKKTLEEAGELLEAAAKLKLLSELSAHLPEDVYMNARSYIMDELRDAVGDVAVTLINVCALADVDLTSCLEGAYDQIKHRRGHMNEQGIFVKEA
jgi:NTP pyrophosphatase (non-canonical NTP hydrolase)